MMRYSHKETVKAMEAYKLLTEASKVLIDLQLKHLRRETNCGSLLTISNIEQVIDYSKRTIPQSLHDPLLIDFGHLERRCKELSDDIANSLTESVVA